MTARLYAAPVIAAVLALVWAFSTASPLPDPEQAVELVVDATIERLEVRDVDGAMAVVSDDFEVAKGGPLSRADRTMLESLAREVIERPGWQAILVVKSSYERLSDERVEAELDVALVRRGGRTMRERLIGNAGFARLRAQFQLESGDEWRLIELEWKPLSLR
ncbi:MAG: hypothetical protein IV100_11530 [Myxococcales bacterium]|nr:hypothetical protein [Myxococcales bacterium]